MSKIHQEAIHRFLSKLDKLATSALGDIPQLHVIVCSCPVNQAEEARYLDYRITNCLIISIEAEPHARALLLSSDVFVAAATGLFNRIRFVWGGGMWSCPFHVPEEDS